MVKKHLGALIDVRLIVFLVVIIALSVILTMVFSDKIKDFAIKHKKKFYIYIFSFVLVYALVAFLGYNKLFTEISDEFLFYQIASLLFGTLHVYLYRVYFNEYDQKLITAELLFSLLITLYSSVLFIIIYTALNGIGLTFLMCSHFLVFIVPTGVYAVFNYMLQIPPKEYVTWRIPENAKNIYPPIEDKEMIDLLLITLLIQKDENSAEFSSIRAKAPVRIDFNKLFYHTTKNYNDRYINDPIELKQGSENCNWVFFLQPKWYQQAKYIDPGYTLGMNGVTENSVIICKRQKNKKVESANKKRVDSDIDFLQAQKNNPEKEKNQSKIN